MTVSTTDLNLPPSRIFLTGFMGAGKSTIGSLLAHQCGYRFYDTDKMMIKGFKKPISEIFKTIGEARFRSAEFEVLQALCKRENVVVSTGGGTLAQQEPMTLALAHGHVIYLKAPIDVLYERVIFSPKDRPILSEPETEQVFREKYAVREQFYTQAQLVIETHERHREVLVAEIMNALQLPYQKV